MKKINCDLCNKLFEIMTGHYNRSMKLRAGLFCSRACSHENRRRHVPIEVKKEQKRLYDNEYRKKNKERLKKEKAEYFQRVYKEQYEKFKAIRKARMKDHIEYCRQPKYKAYKKKYDRKYRNKKIYGEYFEAAGVLTDLEILIRKTMPKYERYYSRGMCNKALNRSRIHGNTKRSYT